MRLRRIEFIVIALTFAFVCFMGGYFAGSRDSVSIVSVESQFGETQQISPVTPQIEDKEVVPPDSAAGSEAKNADSTGESDDNPATVIRPDGNQAGAAKGGDGRININLASQSELMDLPGIGNVLSGRIVDYRNQYGAFSSIEEIRNVSGIGEKRYEAIKNKITVN